MNEGESLRFGRGEVHDPTTTISGHRIRMYIPCNDEAYVVARTEGHDATLTNLSNRGAVNINVCALDGQRTMIAGTLSVLEPGQEVASLSFPAGSVMVVAVCPKFDGSGVLDLDA
jgi:hypothetical protein